VQAGTDDGFQAGTDDGYRVESPRLLAVLALAALVSALAACGGERPLVGDTLRLVAEGSVGGTRWAVLGDTGRGGPACCSATTPSW